MKGITRDEEQIFTYNLNGDENFISFTFFRTCSRTYVDNPLLKRFWTFLLFFLPISFELASFPHHFAVADDKNKLYVLSVSSCLCI
jgi:hypothetical protein